MSAPASTSATASTTLAGLCLPRLALPRIVRRHRRLTAAALAAVAVLLIGVATQPTPPAPVDGGGTAAVPAGMVAVPLTLADSAVAGLLHGGERVDVIALPGETSGIAHVIARDVLVLTHGSSGFLSNAPATLLVATEESSAIAIAAAAAGSGLTVIVHPPS